MFVLYAWVAGGRVGAEETDPIPLVCFCFLLRLWFLWLFVCFVVVVVCALWFVVVHLMSVPLFARGKGEYVKEDKSC